MLNTPEWLQIISIETDPRPRQASTVDLSDSRHCTPKT
ncbi:hypothetical protein ADIMK_2408 [Marinobacterium lacunae]|uniref:Uncharacterized protein n=1 Tax=Marinobacterium lacunae TaxID=1232683 RepID=A0A081FXW6_9GAMM|nr:hypothetical protein ADIMK_2408 [Marinobacterium lacunae]